MVLQTVTNKPAITDFFEQRRVLLHAGNDVVAVFRMIADPPVPDGHIHRASGGHEVENKAELVIVQCGDGVIAGRDLRRCGDGVRALDDQLADRYRDISNQGGVNKVTEIDNTGDAVAVDERVQAADVVVDDLRA